MYTVMFGDDSVEVVGRGEAVKVARKRSDGARGAVVVKGPHEQLVYRNGKLEEGRYTTSDRRF
jgi:hypothetical protein